jgi:hypothetical protein
VLTCFEFMLLFAVFVNYYFRLETFLFVIPSGLLEQNQ